MKLPYIKISKYRTSQGYGIKMIGQSSNKKEAIMCKFGHKILWIFKNKQIYYE